MKRPATGRFSESLGLLSQDVRRKGLGDDEDVGNQDHRSQDDSQVFRPAPAEIALRDSPPDNGTQRRPSDYRCQLSQEMLHDQYRLTDCQRVQNDRRTPFPLIIHVG